MIAFPADPHFDLTNRVIAFVGAAGGIGAPVVRALAARGVRLALIDHDRTGAERLAAEVGRDALPFAADICSEDSVAATMAEIQARFGRLDGLVNAAGYLHIAPAADMELAAFRRSLDVNLTGAFLVSRAARSLMREGGSIVHISSVSSAVSNLNYAAYASSKAGLAQLVRVLAREWAPQLIRVNAIGPAMIETPFTAGYLSETGFRDRALASIPMARFGRPEDLFGPVIMLLAPSSEFLTGQTIFVDGGRTLV